MGWGSSRWGTIRWGSGPTGGAVYYAEALIGEILGLEE